MPPLVNPNKAWQESPNTDAITSASMAPTPAVNYQAPAYNPPFNTAAITTPAPVTETLGAEGQKAQNLSTGIQGLRNELTGESDYRLQQENQMGIPTISKDINDYTAQIKGFQLEQQALQNDFDYTIPNRMQQGVANGGAIVTAGGLQPHTTAALRNNQIKQGEIATRALTTSAALAASQGNLTNALYSVDRAVQERFGRQKAELDASIKNLEMITKSPAYSLEQKNKAEETLTRKNAEAKAVEVAEKNFESIQALGLQALQNGAPPAIVSSIMNSKDLFSAYTAASGYAAKETASSIQEYNFAVRGGYKGSFSDYQNEDANRKAVVARAGVSNGITTGAPSSYKEWELAGKPGTYAQWLADSNVKAPTVAQQTVATYAARLEQSTPIISNLEGAISSMNAVKFEAQKRLPSYLQSAEYQQFDQAARNFINAVLRRESGAVISPSEFDNAYKQYLPRPGDTTATLQQKKLNRELVNSSLRKAAGNAYQSVDELIGSTTSGAATFKSSGGNSYKLPY